MRRPEELDGTLLAQVQDPVTPSSLLLTSTDLATPALLKQSSPTFDATGLRWHGTGDLGGRRAHPVPADPSGRRAGWRGAGLPDRLWRLPRAEPAVLPSHGKLWLERGGTT